MAQSALTEDEYFDGLNMANTIPFVDCGDAMDRMVDAFDHGVIASKKVKIQKNAGNNKLVGFGGGSFGEEMLSLNPLKISGFESAIFCNGIVDGFFSLYFHDGKVMRNQCSALTFGGNSSSQCVRDRL